MAKPQDMEIKVRTTCEFSVFFLTVGIILTLSSIVSLFFVKTFIGAAVVLLVPLVYFAVMFFLAMRHKNALVMNVIDLGGVKNRYIGNSLCELTWGEIGDFGIVEVKKGLFSGRYIYMSRVFVASSVRKDLLNRYDPRVCVVFPYTEQVCRAITRLSGGKINIR